MLSRPWPTSQKGPSIIFDYTGKTHKAVFEAAVNGHTSVEEASMWLHGQLLAATDASEVTKYKASLDAVKSLHNSRYEMARNTTGVYLYTWALTHRFVSHDE